MSYIVFPIAAILLGVGSLFAARRALLLGRRHYRPWYICLAMGFIAAGLTSGLATIQMWRPGLAWINSAQIAVFLTLGPLFLVSLVLAILTRLFRSRLRGEVEIVNRARVAIRSKNYGEAETECRTALRLNSMFVDAHYLLGLALMNQKRYEESERSLSTALRLWPSHNWARYQCGFTLAKLGRHSEAIGQYEKALYRPLHGDKSQRAKAGLRCDLALSLVEEARIEEAIDVTREVFAQFPGHGKAHYAMGRALLATGKAAAAELQFGLALQSQPKFPEAARYREIAAGQQASQRLREHTERNLRYT